MHREFSLRQLLPLACRAQFHCSRGSKETIVFVNKSSQAKMPSNSYNGRSLRTSLMSPDSFPLATRRFLFRGTHPPLPAPWNPVRHSNSAPAPAPTAPASGPNTPTATKPPPAAMPPPAPAAPQVPQADLGVAGGGCTQHTHSGHAAGTSTLCGSKCGEENDLECQG